VVGLGRTLDVEKYVTVGKHIAVPIVVVIVVVVVVVVVVK